MMGKSVFFSEGTAGQMKSAPSFAKDDDSTLSKEPNGSKIGLGPKPIWGMSVKVLLQAGYRSGSMITSKSNLIFAYILYLIGTEYRVNEHTLRRVLARWFFMASITGRYTNSTESAMEFDLARFREKKDAAGFVAALEQMCNESITQDYWAVVLPNELATSSPRSPSPSPIM